MGIFSKKDLICERCGKAFQARIVLGQPVCNECLDKEINERGELNKTVRGYIDYRADVCGNEYSIDELREIVKHRDAILEKYRLQNGVTREELVYANNNYKAFTEEMCNNILARVEQSSLEFTLGAGYSGAFFVPAKYENVVVDADDIFAVGYTTTHKISEEGAEGLLCVAFTNDPYIPIFPMVYSLKQRFFEVIKSKKGREAATELFTQRCKNLTYPVGDLKQLKAAIEQEMEVRGNIDKKTMLRNIADAKISTGIFNPNKMQDAISSNFAHLLEQYGYMQTEEADSILLSGMMAGRFWKKQMQRYVVDKGILEYIDSNK